MTFRHLDIEMFKQVNDYWFFQLEFLFEKAHHDLINFVNCHVDHVLAQVFELAEFKRF